MIRYAPLFETTREQRLVRLLKRTGPIVTVGRPGDLLPPLGARRLYLAEDEWQSEVRQLMEISSLVVIMASSSDGVLWEVSETIARVCPQNIAIYLDRLHRYESLEEPHCRFVATLNRCLPQPIPESLFRHQFVYFDSEWTPKATDKFSEIQKRSLN